MPHRDVTRTAESTQLDQGMGYARSDRRIRHTALRRMHPIRVFGLDSLSGTDWELDEVLAMADPAPMVPRRSQSTRARPIRANLTDASKHRKPPQTRVQMPRRCSPKGRQ